MSEKPPTDELRAEHKVARAKMRELTEAAARRRGEETARWAEVGEELRERAAELQGVLRLHFSKEEEGLFPDVLSLVSRGAPRVDILANFFGDEADDDLKAHTLLRGRMKDLLVLLDEAAEAGEFEGASRARLNTLVGLTKDLLERHATKEDELVFPMIERLLDESQMAAVRDRMQEISRR